MADTLGHTDGDEEQYGNEAHRAWMVATVAPALYAEPEACDPMMMMHTAAQDFADCGSTMHVHAHSANAHPPDHPLYIVPSSTSHVEP